MQGRTAISKIDEIEIGRKGETPETQQPINRELRRTIKCFVSSFTQFLPTRNPNRTQKDGRKDDVQN